MQQAGAAGHGDIHAQLAGQQAGQPGHFHAVDQGVLAKTGAVLQAADQLDQVGVQAMDAQLHDSPLALFLHLYFQLAAALLHRLLDAGGMDTAVAHQALQGHAGHFAPGLIKGGQGDGLGGIVDDQVHAGGRLQGADIAALAANDPAFHLVAGQGHHRDGGLAGMVGGAAADGLGDHVPGDVLTLVLQVGLIGSHPQSLFVHQLLVHLVQQHFPGVGLAQAGQGLQPLHLFGAQSVGLGQMFLGFGHLLFDVLFPLFQRLGLFVQGVFLLVDAVFLPADLSPALFDLLVGLGLLGVYLRLHAEHFVLGFQDGFLLFLGGGLDRFVHQPGRLGLGAADLGLSGLFAVAEPRKKARRSTGSKNDDSDHDT